MPDPVPNKPTVPEPPQPKPAEPALPTRSLASETIKQPSLFWFIVWPLVFFALLIVVWPKDPQWKTPLGTDGQPIAMLAWVTPEIRLMLIVMVAAAIGSAVHSAKSYVYFRGMDSYQESWNAWYWLRIPIGVGLALLVYLVFRAGLFAGSMADTAQVKDTVNPFGFAAIAALSGMYSRQAYQKLEEIFNNLFQVEDKPQPPPEIKMPESVKKGVPVALVIEGKGLNKSSRVLIDGRERAGTSFKDGKITVPLAAEDVKEVGALQVEVRNRDGGSDSQEVRIVA